MKLTTVSITGADDKVDPKDLAELSRKYPFVEWAILLSSTAIGKPRFPTLDWIQNLSKYDLNLAGHLCGYYVRNFVESGDDSFKIVSGRFKRFQINFHAEEYLPDNSFISRLDLAHQWIFQMDGVNENLYYNLRDASNIVPIFDTSFGTGVFSGDWRDPIADYCGYAGGINPDNIESVIENISSKTGSKFWIDMESGVRTNNEFDLAKVEKCLEIASKYV